MTEHLKGWAGRASELPIFRKDRIFLGRKGRVVLTPITHMWVMYNPQFIRNELVVSWCLGARNTPPWSHGSTGPGVVHQAPWRKGGFSPVSACSGPSGQSRRHRTSFLGLVATLSSRDASRPLAASGPAALSHTKSGPPARPRYRRGPSTSRGGQEGPRSYQSFERIEYFWAGRAEWC